MVRRLPIGRVVYQVYPRSFNDSNGDGVGDLLGIIQRLDYLRRLGVDLLWLSPIYPSPLADGGYDVADYTNVHAMFGTLDDFDDLVIAAAERGIGVIVDAVLSHSSSLHPWFIESRASRDNPKRGWYIWRDPAPDGGPPNNWISVFGGSAWELDEATGQYYLHSFLKEQPDLNWENPEVQVALQNVLRFWFSRTVLGIRVDAWDWVGKDLVDFRDDPVNPAYNPATDHDPYHQLLHVNSTRGPRLRAYTQMLEAVALEFPGRFIVTESYPRGEGDPRQEFREILDRHTPGLSAPFNFGLMGLPQFDALPVKRLVDGLQAELLEGEMLVTVFGNHDSRRLASRIGTLMARTAAMLLLTLPGMSVIYAGDELGLPDGVLLAHEVRDPATAQHPELGRDPGRTPMLWTVDQPNAGFTTGKPWLPITQQPSMSVEAQLWGTRSMLRLYQALIELRRQEEALRLGRYTAFAIEHPEVFGYVRHNDSARLAVLLNLSDEEVRFGTRLGGGELLLTTELDMSRGPVGLGAVTLRPGEGWVVRLN